MRAAACNTWATLVAPTPDPRARRGRRYRWATLLILICAARLSGQQQGAAIAQWVREHALEWQAWAPTTRGRIPSAATLRRTLRRTLRLLDPQALDQVLGEWATHHLPPLARPADQPTPTELPSGALRQSLRAVAVDGKAVRGAQTHGTALHLVSRSRMCRRAPWPNGRWRPRAMRFRRSDSCSGSAICTAGW